MAYSDTEVLHPRKRRGRGVLIILLVLVALLGIAAVVIDRFGSSYAERRIADQVAAQIQQQKATSDRPAVDITGFPFVTQVLRGNYDDIRIQLRNLTGTAQGETVKVPLVDIHALDVRAPLQAILGNQGSIVATTVNGTATIDYASVTALINRPGLQLSERGGKLAVTAPLEALGRTITVSGTASLTVAEGSVQVRFEQLSAPELAAIPFARNLVNNYAKQISVGFKLPQLPLNLKIQQVTPTAAGLQVTATASEVGLNRRP